MRHVFDGTDEVSIANARDVDAALRGWEAGVHAHYRPVRVRPTSHRRHAVGVVAAVGARDGG